MATPSAETGLPPSQSIRMKAWVSSTLRLIFLPSTNLKLNPSPLSASLQTIKMSQMVSYNVNNIKSNWVFIAFYPQAFNSNYH